MIHRCPCCGSELGCPGLLWLPLAGLLLRTRDQTVAQFTDSEAAIFDVLWQEYAASSRKPSPFHSLVEAVYRNNSNGGPDGAELCVYQFIHKIKRKLRPFGLRLYVREHAVLLCQEMSNVPGKDRSHLVPAFGPLVVRRRVLQQQGLPPGAV